MLKQNSVFKKVLSLLLSIVFAISSFTVAGFSSLSALADDGDYYMFAYFTGNEDTRQYDNNNQAIRFAVSTDGLNFKALNDNKPAIEQLGGSLNVRDPYLFKGADDYYYIIGTDLDCITMGWWGNQPQMVLWRSLDLVNWTDETYINTAQICGLNNNQVYRTWAPQVFYDEASGKYMVYFAFAADGYNSTNMYYMMTSDLLDQSKYSLPQQLYRPYDDPANPCYQNNNKDCIDADITYQNGTYYMFYKDEGASTVCLATSTKLNEDYRYVGKCATSTETANIEGCEVYKIGNNYYLVADRFSAAGRFAIYNLGSDLSAITASGGSINMNDGNPITTVDGLNGFENLSVRHGSIMHINKTQYDALIAKYGVSDKDDVKFVFDRAYSAEDSWHYDTIKDASGYNFSLMTNTGGYSYVHSQSNCVAINGATMFIQDGDIKNMFDNGKSWTVSFNANIVSKRGAPLFALTSGAEVNGVNSKDWIRFLDNGDFYINNGSEYVKKGSTDITTTTDYDFDITYNGTYITLYKDGVKQFTSNIGTLGFDKNGVTSYTAWGWTDTCGVTGVNATYTDIRFRSKALSYAEVSNEYTDNLIYQYNEGTHEAIDGRADVTYNNPQTTTTYNGKRGASFAVSGWVDVGAYRQDAAVLFEFGEGGTGDGKNYLTLLEDGTVKWCWSEGSTPRYVDIGSIYSFEPNTWYYVQINVVPDGSQYHFQAFVNGESTMDVTSGYTDMQTQAYGPVNFLSTNRQLRFGKGNAYWTTDSYNVIDDIRVYNRAVDAAANYAKVLIDESAADARTYVRANLDGYDVDATANKASRKAYFMNADQEAVGGYSNVVACSTGVSYNYVWDDSSKKNNVHYSLWYPSDIVLMYDGVNTPALPVQMELHNYNSSGNNSNLNTVYCYNGSSNGAANTNWKFAHYWTGSGDNYEVWSGTSKTYNHSKEYPDASDGKAEVQADGNDHVGYYPGEAWDYVFNMPNADGCFFWNKINYIGTGNTSTYADTFTTIPVQAYQNGYQTLREVTHNMYVINYEPIYNMLKAASPTAVPNAGGLGLKAVYDNLVKDNENNWTTDSLNQFYVAAYKVLKANPMEYSEATYQADFAGTASKAASNIKDAVSEFNKINLQARADFSDLEDAVADATDILDNSAEDYTAASIAALQDAVNAVTYTAYNTDERANMAADVYQNDIEDEETAIREAIAALIEKKTVTFVEFGGASTTVKYESGTAAATVGADAPALPSDNYDSVANKHYTYAWDNAFAEVTANATYTQVRSEVEHVYGSYTHVDLSSPSQHTATCNVNGQNHTDTFNCVFEEEAVEAFGDTNSYTKYTCKDCGYTYNGNYGVQNWTAYDEAVAAYDAADDEAGFTAKYTEASRTAYANAASSKLTKAETVSQSAINAAATALEEAVSGLTVQNYTITYKYWGVATTESAVLPYGASAEDVAAEAPENTATNYNETRHYTFAWEAFTTVTENKTYNEERTSTAHSYSSLHTNADGNTNGFTTYTCACGHSYVEYDATNWNAYDTAAAAYDAADDEEDFAVKYTAASREAYASAASSKLTKADTVSQAAINNATTALENAVSGLTVRNYTIGFYQGAYVPATQVSLQYGTSAEVVASYAPANRSPVAKNALYHIVYTWGDFEPVTGDHFWYEEVETTVPHSYTDAHTDADGDANGYTVYTCVCGASYTEYDPTDWTAYDTAVAAYDAAAADIAADEGKYTAASVSEFYAVTKLTKANTVSQSAINNATAALIAAVDGLEEAHDNGYNLTLEDDIEVNFYIDTESYDAEDGYITYTFLKDPAEFSAEREEVVIQDDSELLVKLPDGRRKLNVQVAPAQLAEKFRINVYDKYGNKKTDEAIETSISDYCESLLGIEAYSEYHAVVQTLLDYGALADEYFGYAAISKEVTGEDYEVPHSADYKANVDAESFRARAKSSFVSGVDASGAQVRITGVSYVALVDPEFRFYVNQTSDVWCYYTDLSISDPSLKAEWIKTDNGNCVRVTGLKSSDFGKNFTITIGTAQLTYNGYAYLYTNLREASTLSTELKNLSKGVYRYAVACEELFNN